MLTCSRPRPQLEFGAIFRGTQLDHGLLKTWRRLRRGSEATRDFTGVALLEAHPFLSDPDLLAQGPSASRLYPAPAPLRPHLASLPPSFSRTGPRLPTPERFALHTQARYSCASAGRALLPAISTRSL